jgi:hypothetical protein
VRMRQNLWYGTWVSIAIQLCVVSAGRADPVCPTGMAPPNCAEAQLAAIGKIFGEYKSEVARLDNQIATLKETVSKQQTIIDAILKKTDHIIITSSSVIIQPDSTQYQFNENGNFVVFLKDLGACFASNDPTNLHTVQHCHIQ